MTRNGRELRLDSSLNRRLLSAPSARNLPVSFRPSSVALSPLELPLMGAGAIRLAVVNNRVTGTRRPRRDHQAHSRISSGRHFPVGPWVQRRP
jgi:hypothetical protein